jgi:hypothetical protein
MHNNIVQTIEASSDMKAHIGVIQGDNNISYFGQKIVKYIFTPISQSVNIRTYYLAFNFAVLIGVFYTIFFVFRNLIGLHGAYISSFSSLFLSSNILGLFKFGVIFNIINVYIIFPLALYHLIRWFTDGKLYHGIASLLLFGLFSVFHYSGYYILPFAVAWILVWFIRGVVTHKWDNYKKKIAVIIVASAGFIYMISKSAWLVNFQIPSAQPIQYLFIHLSPEVIVMLFMGLIIYIRNGLNINAKSKRLICTLGYCCGVLLLALLLMVTKDFNRVAMDLSGMLTLLTAGIAGVICLTGKKKLNTVVYSLVMIGAIPNLIIWINK